MKPYYDHAGITIYHGDCVDILPQISGDVVVCDPPYGVGLDYGNFKDDESYLDSLVLPAILYCIGRFRSVVLTPGNKHMWKYPKPNDFGVWFNPAGTGFGPWGFLTSHAILYYGKDPKPRTSATSVTGLNDRSSADGHPCAKPRPFMGWLVNKASLESDLVIDPFMGSGTTLTACKDTGRRAIGIEIEERYCEIAAKRLSQEVFEFESRPPKNGTDQQHIEYWHERIGVDPENGTSTANQTSAEAKT